MLREAIRGVGRFIAAGRPKRSEEEQAKCHRICKKCPKFVKHTKLGPRCEECGCVMDIKSWWVTENCPIGRW